jgi:hypothetical protein
LFIYIGIFAQNNPKELGTVNRYRNLQKAKSESKSNQKPILILFQEVPGCSTCKNYGSNVLSNPQAYIQSIIRGKLKYYL